MTNILFAAGPELWADYETPLRRALDRCYIIHSMIPLANRSRGFRVGAIPSRG